MFICTWICPQCKSTAITRSTPIASSNLATSAALIAVGTLFGLLVLSVLVLYIVQRNRRHAEAMRKSLAEEREDKTVLLASRSNQKFERPLSLHWQDHNREVSGLYSLHGIAAKLLRSRVSNPCINIHARTAIAVGR